MNCASNLEKQLQMFNLVIDYVERSAGLRIDSEVDGRTTVTQALDGKFIEISAGDMDDVLLRSDTEGQEFIQINFCSGKKVLLTSSLIGFKPVPMKGLDLAKLPRVVTTPDLLSVFEAIQDTLHALDSDPHELTVLKRVFEAVLAGGEAIGFDLTIERAWLSRIPSTLTKIAV